MTKRIVQYLFLLPAVAHGDTTIGDSSFLRTQADRAGSNYDLPFLVRLLCKSVDWIFTFSLIIGIIFVLYAAFTYMTSSGNEEKVSQANKSLLYAAIGLLVAVLARGVPSIVASFVGQDITACP